MYMVYIVVFFVLRDNIFFFAAYVEHSAGGTAVEPHIRDKTCVLVGKARSLLQQSGGGCFWHFHRSLRTHTMDKNTTGT